MSLEAMQCDFAEYPMEVSIETFALCNARCTFCPYPTLERKGEKLSDETLNRLVDEMIAWNRPVYFTPFKLSEPFLDKRVIPLCKRINEETDYIGLRLFTNGSTLTPANIEEIAKLKNVTSLWVSLNSHIPEEYEKLMGLKFEQTAKRLDYLHTEVAEGRFPHEVMLSCVGFPNEPFRRYCYDRWPLFQSMAIKKDAWLGYTDAQFPDIPDTGCSRWFELSITAEGKAVTCCMDSGEDERYHLGDVNKQTLYEIYNSPRWKSRRDPVVSRKTLDDSSPCSRCSY